MTKGNINIGDDVKLSTQSTTKVICNDKIIMLFPNGEKEELNVKIEADFKDLKVEHHEIFLRSFSSKYNHNTQIFNTHTNYDGSKVPLVVCKTVDRKPLWKQIKELLKPKPKPKQR